MHWPLIRNFFIAFIAVLNPIGNLPVFISYTQDETPAVRHVMACLISVTIFLLFIIFLFLGQTILHAFGISLPAFRIAGGILLLLIGISMIKGITANHAIAKRLEPHGSIFRQAASQLNHVLIPVAVPIFVGPGSICTVIIYSHLAHTLSQRLALAGVILIASLISLGCLLLATKIKKIIGHNGLQITTCLLGLILSSIAIQLILVGLGDATYHLINLSAIAA